MNKKDALKKGINRQIKSGERNKAPGNLVLGHNRGGRLLRVYACHLLCSKASKPKMSNTPTDAFTFFLSHLM